MAVATETTMLGRYVHVVHLFPVDLHDLVPVAAR